MKHLFIIFSLVLVFLPGMGRATESGANTSRPEMTNLLLDELIRRIDPQAEGKNGYWELEYEGTKVLVITDEKADRMRLMTAITKSGALNQSQLHRLMQANFDSALDARYAIAKGVIWSAFIHPLSSLSDKEFFSALAQVITLRQTYGSSFSSGALVFQGGDSASNKQHQDIMRKGLSF